MAADRQCCADFKTRSKKVFRLSNGSLFGGAGQLEQVLAVRAWLDGGDKPEDLDDFAGILVEPGGAYRLGKNLIRTDIRERGHAVGSGSPFAITALLAYNATASEAVRVAARFDPGTGGGIDSLEHQSPIIPKPGQGTANRRGNR